MASIKSLLNPLPEHPVCTPGFGVHYAYPTIAMARNTSSKRHKIPPKNKIPKDAAVFKPNEPTGEIRYPPCEERSERLTEEHRQVKLYPMGADGSIGKYARTIPYKSDKKSFAGKTGRSKFEVFQYTFQYDNQTWIVMWDYNIGLVRITHLFKALGYTKTTPAKVISQNPGLRDIVHSITGGAIAAQGYWFPFEAAKALAARFCYPIRYALTPMFGTDFPDMCVEKGHDSFDNMVLDQSIIEQATITAHYYRSLETSGDTLTGTESTSSTASGSSNSPSWRAEIPICPPILRDEERNRMTKYPRREYTDSIASTRGSSSEPYCMSPSSPGPNLNAFTPVNVPRSHTSPYAAQTEAFLSRAANSCPDTIQSHAYSRNHDTLPTNTQIVPQVARPSSSGRQSVKRSSTLGTYDESDTDSTTDSVENNSAEDEHDEDWREHESRCSRDSSAVSEAGQSKNIALRCVKARSNHDQPASRQFVQEVKAAHALIHLHMQEATASDEDEDGDGDVKVDDDTSDMCRLMRSLDQGHGGRKRRRASV